jgi:hypothetical protein
MTRREFIQALAAASAAGLPLTSAAALDLAKARRSTIASRPFGNVSLLHFTDCHAQLNPIYFREPNVNLGVGNASGKPPHLVGEHLLSTSASPLARVTRTRSPISTSHRRREPTASWAASRIWRRWSTVCERRGRAPCCSTAATRGRARPRRYGRAART